MTCLASSKTLKAATPPYPEDHPRELMKQVKLNPDTEEVGSTFKVIAISITVVLNVLVFGWFFLFSGLVN